MAKQKVSELNLKDKIVYVGRTAKVVKGGRRFNFSAMVVVGDEAGHVGYGLGKAGEVSNAVTKATDAAKSGAIVVPFISACIIALHPYRTPRNIGQLQSVVADRAAIASLL